MTYRVTVVRLPLLLSLLARIIGMSQLAWFLGMLHVNDIVVIGGQIPAPRTSARNVTLGGATAFLVFGILYDGWHLKPDYSVICVELVTAMTSSDEISLQDVKELQTIARIGDEGLLACWKRAIDLWMVRHNRRWKRKQNNQTMKQRKQDKTLSNSERTPCYWTRGRRVREGFCGEAGIAGPFAPKYNKKYFSQWIRWPTPFLRWCKTSKSELVLPIPCLTQEPHMAS